MVSEMISFQQFVEPNSIISRFGSLFLPLAFSASVRIKCLNQMVFIMF